MNKALTFGTNAIHNREISRSSGKNESQNYDDDEYSGFKEQNSSRSGAIEKRGSSGIDLPSNYAKNFNGGDSPT